MDAKARELALRFDLAGEGPAILVLHDDPARQQSLLEDCVPLTAARLRLVVGLVDGEGDGTARVLTLMRQLGIGRAVVIAIGTANRTLVELLDRHPERVAAATFVADRALVRELLEVTDNLKVRDLLRHRRQPNITRAVTSSCRKINAYEAVRGWSARLVDLGRSGVRSCSALLPRLELPGLMQLDEDEEESVEAF